jgi:SAM-dependent methyltransferase
MPAGATVVDVMPWGGTATTQLQRRLQAGAHLDIAELSPHNISFIMERLAREGGSMANVSASLMRGPALPHADRSIDLLVALQVLEHMPDPAAFLDEARRVLRPGGQFIVSIRNGDSDYGRDWAENESRGQVPNQGPFTPLPARKVQGWLEARFLIEADAGIDDGEGDARLQTGEGSYEQRLYATRCRLPD